MEYNQKVYCLTCQWYNKERDECHHKSNAEFEDNYLYKKCLVTFEKPSVINKNNDCKNFMKGRVRFPL